MAENSQMNYQTPRRKQGSTIEEHLKPMMETSKTSILTTQRRPSLTMTICLKKPVKASVRIMTSTMTMCPMRTVETCTKSFLTITTYPRNGMKTWETTFPMMLRKQELRTINLPSIRIL